MEIRITESVVIGEHHPVFIIAEVGNNHQGQFELAAKSIESAKVAGADAVSFQYAPIGTYCVKSMHDDSRVSFLGGCEFSLEQIAQLRKLALKNKLAFSVNVEDIDTLRKMIGIGIDFIKLCSADLTNIPYISFAASMRKPVFFSTGGAFLGEIETAVNAMRLAGLGDYVIYHTNSGYPTPIEDANILQMDLLHRIFGGVKGYCDHTLDIIPPVVAGARGAKVIEKHITTQRALKGDDWMVSLEPDEFKRMVGYIRAAEKSLGTEHKKPLPIEENTRIFKRKSIVSKRVIVEGTIIQEGMLTYKVPGSGISPMELTRVVGKRAIMNIGEDILIEPHMIETVK